MGNKYIGMNFLGLKLLDILIFLVGATTLDQFFKANVRAKKNVSSHMNGLAVVKN